MSYEFDVFLSYRRSSTAGPWVRNHFYPRLKARINEVAPRDISIWCDTLIEDGSNWPDDLKRKLKRSGILLAVWSSDYFRARWCMAEWQSFKARETQLGMFDPANPSGLISPIRYADGKYYHPDALATQCTVDFSSVNAPDDAFQRSERYVIFDDYVKQCAEALVTKIAALPPWREDFPIVEPDPLPPPQFTRPIL